MKIRILLIDDASFIRDLIKRTLRKYLPQCEIIEGADGRKGQSILNRQPVDLILSDWEMPGLSGEELLQWVRADEKLAGIPFIMITSLGGKEHIMRAVQAGVSDYLGKPFTGEELMQKVQKALIKSGKLSKASPGSSSKSGPFSSLEIFSGKADSAPSGSLEALTGGAKAKEAPKLKGTALVSWGQVEFRCMIKAISIDEVLLVCKRGAEHPSVFAPAIVTLSPGNQASKSITDLCAYVHSISAVEKRPDAEFLNLLLRFSNPSDEQRSLLSNFILENP
ncbi:MAG: two-component system response regulator [Gammaproteobacteria bacterium]|nr:two-component system response regulator [Gammaproteobacteria bacterium]|tara:strand:- start:1784 stop:2620 length:837 start_codon:yes stop_codon:yes gene_type:complete